MITSVDTNLIARAATLTHEAHQVTWPALRGNAEGLAKFNHAVSESHALLLSAADTPNSGWARSALRDLQRAADEVQQAPADFEHATMKSAQLLLARSNQRLLQQIVLKEKPALHFVSGQVTRAVQLRDRIIDRGATGSDWPRMLQAMRDTIEVHTSIAEIAGVPEPTRQLAEHTAFNLGVILESFEQFGEHPDYTPELGRALKRVNFVLDRGLSSTRSITSRLLAGAGVPNTNFFPGTGELPTGWLSSCAGDDHGGVGALQAMDAGRMRTFVAKEDVTSGLPQHRSDGTLPPGTYRLTWDELVRHFRSSPRRSQLLIALKAALPDLRAAGVDDLRIGGSFVRTKESPGDIDIALFMDPNADVPAVREALNRHWNNGIHCYWGSESDFFRKTREGGKAGLVALSTNSAP
jgi:hypothetical protein